ncbi:hypothetical protein SBA4_3170005 [Candidatus Sulfopaludibacter sp. SbA4]|nr:hypothetical protein SBA4_3170005 [Candidatus Sulfopaludibacter sp. SbA4]
MEPFRRLDTSSPVPRVTAIVKKTLNRRHPISIPLRNPQNQRSLQRAKNKLTSAEKRVTAREAQIVKTTLNLRLPISSPLRNPQKQRSLGGHEK